MKKINPAWTLFEILEKYPELEDPLYNLGFSGVKDPEMRRTHAKVMTLSAGSVNLNIGIEKIRESLGKAGFQLED